MVCSKPHDAETLRNSRVTIAYPVWEPRSLASRLQNRLYPVSGARQHERSLVPSTDSGETPRLARDGSGWLGLALWPVGVSPHSARAALTFTCKRLFLSIPPVRTTTAIMGLSSAPSSKDVSVTAWTAVTEKAMAGGVLLGVLSLRIHLPRTRRRGDAQAGVRDRAAHCEYRRTIWRRCRFSSGRF